MIPLLYKCKYTNTLKIFSQIYEEIYLRIYIAALFIMKYLKKMYMSISKGIVKEITVYSYNEILLTIKRNRAYTDIISTIHIFLTGKSKLIDKMLIWHQYINPTIYYLFTHLEKKNPAKIYIKFLTICI